jgi:diguanylate cyclase (GGDEF)-like protein
MSLAENISRMVFGTTRKMRRVMTYWAATALLYCFCCLVMWREVTGGYIARPAATVIVALCLSSMAAFYILLRCAPRFKIPNWKLALAQAQFAIVFDLALYAVLDNLAGAFLIGLPVVFVFCAFSLRPRQTIWLSGFAIVALVATTAALAWLHPLRHPLYEASVYFALTTFGIVSVTVITGELSKLRAQLEAAVATIRTLATTDELTLLANRRHMRDVLAAEQQRRAASPNEVCVALLDIDFFKTINDKYGHAGGDAVLQSFAREAGATLRAADTLARWGGEEFLLLMPDTRLDEALAVLGRIATRIRAMRIDAVDPHLAVTFSAGVTASRPLERFDEAISRADAAMYRAKANGRNCVLAA